MREAKRGSDAMISCIKRRHGRQT